MSNSLAERKILAMHQSVCGICLEVIHEGEYIVYVEDEWVHYQCAEDEGYD